MTDTGLDAAGIPSDAPRTRRIMWGRIIGLIGALAISGVLFLPLYAQYEQMGAGRLRVTGITPIEAFQFGGFVRYANLSGYVADLAQRLYFVGPFIASLLLVPFLTLRTASPPCRVRGENGLLAWLQTLISLVVLIVAVFGRAIFMVAYALKGDLSNELIYVGVGVVGLVLAVVAMVRCHPPRKATAAMFALSVYLLARFAHHVWFLENRFSGLWVSIAACGLLTLGAAIDWFQSRPGRPESAGADH